MSDLTPDDAQRLDPQHARSEQAAETPAQPDAEAMESALREGGFLGSESAEDERRRREQSTEDGPGTSLT